MLYIFSLCFRCITIQYISPSDMFLKLSDLPGTAKKILEMILDLGIKDNPIVFHVFSNAGGMLYRHISGLLSTPSFSKLNVVGCIFDSCPTEKGLVACGKAVLSMQGINIFLRYAMALLLMGFFFFRILFYRLLNKEDTALDYWDFMNTEQVKWPSLYLYSKADTIVNYRHVQSVIAERRRLGANISEVCWQDSIHVSHLAKHPREYSDRCLRFLDECLVQQSERKGDLDDGAKL